MGTKNKAEAVDRLALSVREFSDAMGINTSTSWKYIAQGQIRVVRFGGRTLIAVEELKRLLTDGLVRQPVAAGLNGARS